MELAGTVLTALLLGLLGLAGWFGYLLLTARRTARRTAQRAERDGAAGPE